MNYFIQKKKGEISLPLAVVGSLIMSTIMGVGAYFTSVNAQDKNLAAVSQSVAVVETRVNGVDEDIGDIKDDIKDLNTKIDKLLWANGIKP